MVCRDTEILSRVGENLPSVPCAAGKPRVPDIDEHANKIRDQYDARVATLSIALVL